MTNEELEIRFTRLVKTERKITLEVLKLIREADQRRHYLAQGFSSTNDWLIRGHGYTHSAANRRVQAARLLHMVPNLEAEITSGSLNLSILSLCYSTIHREEVRIRAQIPESSKKELVEMMVGKSYEEGDRLLRERFPLAIKKESLRSINGEDSRLSLNLSREDLAALRRARELLSHAIPSGGWSEIIGYLARFYLKRKDPMIKNPDSAAHCINSYRCQFRDEKTGRVCGSRYQLQRDHILPRALGGTDAPENIRILCRRHNLYEAERLLGKPLMDRYRRH